MRNALISIFAIIVGGWVWRRYEESKHVDLVEGCAPRRVNDIFGEGGRTHVSRAPSKWNQR